MEDFLKRNLDSKPSPGPPFFVNQLFDLVQQPNIGIRWSRELRATNKQQSGAERNKKGYSMGRGSAGMQPICNTIWPIESARCQVSSRAAWPAECHQVIYYLTQIPHLHVGISRLGRGHDAVVIEFKRDKGPAPYLPTEGGCH